jgi:hypothetical protein
MAGACEARKKKRQKRQVKSKIGNHESHETPSAAFGRNQNLLSPRRRERQEEKTGPRCSYPLRSWRLCEIPNSLGSNDLRRVCSKIFARRQDLNK